MVDAQGQALPAGTMPKFAGEEMRLHDAVAYWEGAQAALAHAGLLKSAMGMVPDDASKIVDIDPSELPVLPADHPQYYRQLLARFVRQHDSNANPSRKLTPPTPTSRQHLSRHLDIVLLETTSAY